MSTYNPPLAFLLILLLVYPSNHLPSFHTATGILMVPTAFIYKVNWS